MKIWGYNDEGIYELKNWAWLENNYGLITIQAGEKPRYQIVELKEVKDTYSGMEVTVLDREGLPVSGKIAVLWYDTAPRQPYAGWLEQGDLSHPTDGRGKVGVGYGGGAKYDPNLVDSGPHKLWLFGEGESEMISGLGWLGGTKHDHIDVVFQETGEPIEPGETRYFDEEGEISEAKFHSLMGQEAGVRRAVGLPRLVIREVHLVQKPKDQRIMEVQAREENNRALGGVPIKWGIEGTELAVRETQSSDGFARYLLDSRVVYPQSETPPMFVRIKKAYGVPGDVFIGGQVRITGAYNRHANLVYRLMTEDQQPIQPPDEVGVRNVTQTSIGIFWSAVERAKRYSVVVSGTTELATEGPETEMNITGLLPATSYLIAVAAFDGEFWSPYSDVISVTTAGDSSAGCDLTLVYEMLETLLVFADGLGEGQKQALSNQEKAVAELEKIVTELKRIE